MASLHMELRNVHLGFDLGGLHRNSDRPGFYPAWISVADGFLPLKGTAHRAIRGDHEIKPAAVNEFTSSSLWRLQGFGDGFPVAVGEQDFHIPSARSHLAGHDCRRNLTDAQETAQWVSGEDCMVKILEGLLGHWVYLRSFYIFAPLHVLRFGVGER